MEQVKKYKYFFIALLIIGVFAMIDSIFSPDKTTPVPPIKNAPARAIADNMPVLELQNFRWEKEDDHLIANGAVKNISNHSINNADP